MTTGLSCEGDSVAMTAATNPSLEDIIPGVIPGHAAVVIHNQVVAYEVGHEYVQAWYDAEQGKLDPFVLIIEGSIGNEEINGEGHWTGFGVNPERPAHHHQRVGRPARAQGRGRGRRSGPARPTAASRP
jgi:hydrogenase small subunit